MEAVYAWVLKTEVGEFPGVNGRLPQGHESDDFPKLETVIGIGRIAAISGSRLSGSALHSGSNTLRVRVVPHTIQRYFAVTIRNSSQRPRVAAVVTSATCHNAFTAKFNAKPSIVVNISLPHLWGRL